jgi:hypothetical protein
MAGYSREMLIDAYLSRYISTGNAEKLRPLAERHYDLVGKDAFRVSASLDAQAIRDYRALKK